MLKHHHASWQPLGEKKGTKVARWEGAEGVHDAWLGSIDSCLGSDSLGAAFL